MRARRAWIAAIVLALAGCAPPVREVPTAPAALPADFPEAHYRQAAAQGKPVFRVDPKASLVVIEVRRAGKLAHLGHDHVVASHDVGGWVAPDEGRADLYVELERLAVDEAPLRAEAGFATQPSETDIEGTRANMLDKVLEVDKFPFALVGVRRGDAGTLSVSVTLHGKTRTLRVPAKIEAGAAGIGVTGRFPLDQTDFGITLYAVLGGAVAVRDRLDLRFDIRARRLPGGD